MPRAVDPRNLESVDNMLAAMLRGKSPAEKVAMIEDANQTARVVIAAGVRHLHPDWSTDQSQREVARRMLGATD